MSQAWKNAAVEVLIQQASADGYEVRKTAAGRWIWCVHRVRESGEIGLTGGRLLRDGQLGWPTEEEAWGDAIVAHASELMEP